MRGWEWTKRKEERKKRKVLGTVGGGGVRVIESANCTNWLTDVAVMEDGARQSKD